MNSLSIRSLVYIALCSAIFIVLSAVQLKLPFSPIPVTLQTMGLIIAGMLLRPKAAFTSVFIVIILGAVGLPVFGGKSGLAHIFGPTGGFIFYFPLGTMLISYIIDVLEKKMSRLSILKAVYVLLTFIICSSWLSYLVGVPWFMVVLDGMTLQKALTLCFYPFVVPDLMKAVIAFVIFIALYKPIMRIRHQQSRSISPVNAEHMSN